MDEFDPELYLRLAGERLLLDRSSQGAWWDSPLTEAADALVAVGAIEASAAQAAIDDYTLAIALRGEGDVHHALAMRASTPRGAPRRRRRRLKPPRVVPCDRTIHHALGELHVRYVSLTDDATEVAITLRRDVSKQVRPRRHHARAFFMTGGAWGPGGVPQATIVDDRGTKAGTDFSGGGSDGELHGRLHANRPLAADTQWIEIDGERIDLVAAPLPVEVSVEPLPNDDVALRYLWQRVATPDHFHRPPESLDATIDALIDCGALRADDPALDDVRAVLAALGHGQVPPRSGGPRLPEPWRSLLSRGGRADGPLGTIAIGAVTPPFDGVVVAVLSLQSSEEEFQVEVQVTPPVGMLRHFDWSVEESHVAWWAADDRGNHYLGQINGSSASDDLLEADVEFSPPLDPKATRLDLMPTANRARAVISIPLSWTAKPAGTAEGRP